MYFQMVNRLLSSLKILKKMGVRSWRQKRFPRMTIETLSQAVDHAMVASIWARRLEKLNMLGEDGTRICKKVRDLNTGLLFCVIVQDVVTCV